MGILGPTYADLNKLLQLALIHQRTIDLQAKRIDLLQERIKRLEARRAVR